MEYCTAGHPPPLVVSPAGDPLLDPSGAGPLATGSSLETRREELGRSELLLLYSDGLLDRPGTTAARSTMELARAASDAAAGRGLAPGTPARPAELVCHLTLDLLVRAGGHEDDIAVLAAHRVPPTLPSATLPAQPSSVTRAAQPWRTGSRHSGCGRLTRWRSSTHSAS